METLIQDLSRRLRRLEEDEDFVVGANGARIEPNAANFDDLQALKAENETLRRDFAKREKDLEAQLAKERYRIKHLVRALDDLDAKLNLAN
ncbi:hypothetical protein CTAYLR_003566 [Chrysophaeum taylorii]|uniref:Uncharacterized protein n=1 Tax=Chrysophaeum taylorii TaxID=2483200 RepID=A0AAD7ULL3_9STRA|nr:hypothetical protein CTAYLR_003566 [Chrysophaeum taylorii]